jgi:CRISPR/Cas system endoribonuclease Cas6 (RAMP superfamily)
MTGGIEHFLKSTGRAIVKEVVPLADPMQGRWIELPLPRLVFKSHIVFVG